MEIIFKCVNCGSVIKWDGNPLKCGACRRIFEVRSGVPILLKEKEENYLSMEPLYRNVWKNVQKISLNNVKWKEGIDIIEATIDYETGKPFKWGLWNTLWFNQYDGVMIKKLIDFIENAFSANTKLKVLNVGSGLGTYDFVLNRRFPLMEIVGAEIISDGAIGTQKYVENNRMQYVCADALNLPFLDNYFDFAYTKNTIEHAGLEMLREITRVLKTGGYAFVIGPSNESYQFISWRYAVKCLVTRKEFKSHGIPLKEILRIFKDADLDIIQHTACTFRFFQRQQWFKNLPDFLMHIGFWFHRCIELCFKALGLKKYLHMQIIVGQKKSKS